MAAVGEILETALNVEKHSPLHNTVRVVSRRSPGSQKLGEVPTGDLVHAAFL